MVRRFADEVPERGLERDVKERTHDGAPGLEIPLKHRSGFLRWHFFNPKPLRASRPSELDLAGCSRVPYPRNLTVGRTSQRSAFSISEAGVS